MIFLEKNCNNYISEKLVVSGSRMEFYKYSIPIKCDFERKNISTKIKPETNEEYVRRSDNLSRARQNVRRIVWANLTPYTKFLTLTTKDNITDVKQFRRMFTTFLQAMKRNGYDLSYLYVLERQKRGALHAHLVVFNDEKIPLKILKSCWKYGNENIHILNGLKYKSAENICDVGAYVCKYITKESVEEWGTRTYNCSKNLKRPVSVNCKVYGDREIGLIANPNDIERQLVGGLFQYTKFNYCDTKSVTLDRITDKPVIQNIDYFQGILEGECKIEFK